MQVNSTVSFTGKKPPKKPKTQNRGLVAASYAGSLAAIPTSVAAVGATKAMKAASKLNPEETAMLRRGAREGLRQSGLYDKGVRIYRMQEITLPKMRDVIKNFSSYKNSYIDGIKRNFSNLDNFQDKSVGEMIDTVVKTFMPIKFTRKDKKALNALRAEIQEAGSRTNLSGKVFQNMSEKAATDMPEEMQQLTAGIKEAVTDIAAKGTAITYKLGNNAAYLPRANKIITPDKTLQTSVFHEMGHALNNNGGVILKALSKSRPAAKTLPAVILAVALLNKRKTTDEQSASDGKIQRVKDFVKRNAGKLTALSILPMVAEEGIASLRGGKIAKDLFKDGKLSKEILSKVNKTNLAGFASYAAYMAGMVAIANLTIKVKDKLQAKYEAKEDAKYQTKLEKYNAKMAAKEAAKAAKEAKKAIKTTTQA